MTDQYDNILVERRGRVGLVTLNRPEALNELNKGTMDEVVATVSGMDADPELGAVVLTGSAKAFAAGVELLTLESVRLAAPQEQAESLAEASGMVKNAAKSFEQEREARSVDAAIVALRRHTMNVLDAEMEKVRARHGCTAAAEEVEFALRRMVKQLLHVPTVRARKLAASGKRDEYVAALEALYGITVEQPATPAPAQAECPRTTPASEFPDSLLIP